MPMIKFDFYLLREQEEAFEIVEQLFRAIFAGEISQLKKLWSLFSGPACYCCSSSEVLNFPRVNVCVCVEAISLDPIDPELFSEVVIRLEECVLRDIILSTDHHRAVLNKIIETEDLKLKRYYVGWSNMDGISEETIMKAAVKLEETNIYDSLKWKLKLEFMDLFLDLSLL